MKPAPFSRRRQRFAKITRSSKRCPNKARPLLELLEDRTLPSNGQWMAVFGGLPAAVGLTEQAQVGRNFLQHYGVTEENVSVVSAFDLSGTFLLQTPLDATQKTVTDQLDDIPGFIFVQDYEPPGPDAEPVGESDPQQMQSGAILDPFDSGAFLTGERKGAIPDQSGPVTSDSPGNVLINNNAGATATSQFTQSETSILAFGNTVVIGFNDTGSNPSGFLMSTGWSYSTDGGNTFTDGGALPTHPAGAYADTVLSRNNTTGRIYLSTTALGRISIFRSDDNGVSWMAPVNATPGGHLEDKEWHTVDNFSGTGTGNVYLLSRRFGADPGMYFFRSTDNGNTFGPLGGTLIAPASPSPQGAFIAVGPDHALYAFYFQQTSPQRIFVRKSTDFGLTFGAPIEVATLSTTAGNGDQGLTGLRQGETTFAAFRSNAFPHVAVNPVSGHIYVTYADNPPGVDKADVFFTISSNGGLTWTAPVRVNSDATTTDQWQPTIAVSPDGSKVGIFYYSRQEDPANNNLFKYYGSIGAIVGATVTFAPNFAISDVPSLPEFGRDDFAFAPTYMGDYNQAAATPGAFHVAWSDNRDDHPLPAGAPRKDPNVYYAKIDLGLVVASTVPAVGAPVSSVPVDYVVNFSNPIDAATIQATDFTVTNDGGTPVPADSFLIGSPTQVTFHYNLAPFSNQGPHTMAMAAGSVLRLSDHGPLQAFSGAFFFDTTGLVVTSTAPPVGGILTLPAPFTYDVNFNEPIAPGSIGTDDLLLSVGTVTGAMALDADTARYTLSGISTEGTLTITLPTGRVTDTFGNPNPAAFVGVYNVDIGTIPYPTPLVAKPTPGSLVYDPVTAGIVAAAGDSDSFTLAVDPGQTITVVVAPTTAALRPRVELRDPANALLGSATAAAPGQNALLQTRPAARSGTYTVTVSGAGGTTGPYTVQVILNAAQEEEVGATNDTRARAQDIDDSFVTLQTTLASAQRGAVLGGNLAPAQTFDFESGQQGFTIDNGPFPGHVPGLWHLSTRRGAQPGHSPVTSFYFGREIEGDYNVGNTAGTITSGPIALPNNPGAELAFNYVLLTEGDPSFDRAEVQVSTNGGATFTTVLSSASAAQLPLSGVWRNATFSLANFAGQTVLIRFSFDTIDRAVNVFEGWYVDDVRITTPGTWNDYYSFTVGAGETTTVALKHLSGSGANVFLENSAGVVLASGVAGSANLDRVISDLALATAGTYYIRVSGNVAATYSVVVTRNAAFDTELNDSFATAQNVTGTRSVLGHLGGAGSNTLTLSAIDSGWWDDTGFHDDFNNNYITGKFATATFGDFFVFDLASLSQPITGAQLRVFNPSNGFFSADPSETYTLFDITTPIPNMRATGTGQVAIFDDLRSGTPFGSTVVTNASNGQIVTVNLNAAGIADLNSRLGNQAALGGTITTLRADTPYEFLFSSTSSGVRQLVLTLAPPEDWYAVTLAAGQTALRVETCTPADGPGQFLNTLNPRIELYNPSNVPIATGTVLPDGRNEFLQATGLTAGGTYRVRVVGEGGTRGEYFLGVTPLRTPTITSEVDDAPPGQPGHGEGNFNISVNRSVNGWVRHFDAGYLGDYLLHTDNIGESAAHYAQWHVEVTSQTPELFVTWVARPQNATNATYEIYEGGDFRGRVVIDQTRSPNDALLFGNTYAESLGVFPLLRRTSHFLTVRLLTEGANGDLVADAMFDPPTQAPAEEILVPALPQPVSDGIAAALRQLYEAPLWEANRPRKTLHDGVITVVENKQDAVEHLDSTAIDAYFARIDEREGSLVWHVARRKAADSLFDDPMADALTARSAWRPPVV
jgi:hypothetical protein